MSYIERVKAERDELQKKIIALACFINPQNPEYAKLDSDERCLLLLQLGAMGRYNQILSRRIDRSNQPLKPYAKRDDAIAVPSEGEAAKLGRKRISSCIKWLKIKLKTPIVTCHNKK